jgi:uncharacterized lipoprotein YbaY
VPSPLAITQFARIVGRSTLMERLALPPDAQLPDSLTDVQREGARALAAERAEDIAQALLDEAMASDDIQDAASADAYLDDRLRFLAALLPDGARDRIRTVFDSVAGRWG